MEKHCASKRVAGLAFVEAGVAALAQIRVREPLQGEQRPLDSPECAQGARQSVAGARGRKLAQDDRRHDCARLNRGLEPHEFGPQGQDVAGVLDTLGIERADLVTHDIGNMVGYAFAAQYPDRVARFALMDAPLPGIGPWEEILKSPLLWHFRFGGPDMERLVAGRERIYLDRFWNEFSADPKSFGEAAREHYAKLYAQPGSMYAGFSQFAAFDQDAIDNLLFLAKGKLTMPVLAVGGEKSFGPTMAVVMRAAATDVKEVVIAGSGHWLMEEQPAATVAAVRAFLDQRH
jgi:pimeloyl-ACP methyl ester carboxylesterase